MEIRKCHGLKEGKWEDSALRLRLKLHKVRGTVQIIVKKGKKCVWNEKRCKGKAVPLQAWSGPEGYRKLRFPDYLRMTQDGGKVVSLTHRPPLQQQNVPRDIVCLRNMSINTLHKGDDDDDNNNNNPSQVRPC